ncbi:YjbF family lipoprotein [Yoonia sp. F2084L]|uniref:YjbF family lipoprotein n=1 Tax=Yoonia sp. F2084L TaxID=2926419 RepID=UPI001FF67E48|nr:YjbF family lipoprotein [Yoonia sp. F2084L]MCK0097153.1 YjbF family lipoprotein [Yoonia sp. F2084L]
MSFPRPHWFLCAALALAGCGNASNEDDLTGQLWERLTSSGGAPAEAPSFDALRAGFTPAVMAQIDGPVLLVSIPTLGTAAALTRTSVNNGVETFLTADGISISLQDGLVVATRGLGFDLMTADVSEVSRALRGGQSSAVRIHRYLDGENQLVTRSFVCRYTNPVGQGTQEQCTSRLGIIENSYIVDKNGLFSSSRQWISPQIGDMRIERRD